MKPGIPMLWRHADERYLLKGSKCETCGSFYMPARTICPKCRRKGKMVDYRFSGKGRVYSFTVIRVAPEGYEYYVPYVLAIVELEEGPHVMAQLVDIEPEDVRIDMPVELAFRKIHEDNPEGLITYGFKFRPCRDG
ncbi:MAG: Zn-ribbon domain-containing OB-fold protein [Candidatus Asgardarchaeia archaeon]